MRAQHSIGLSDFTNLLEQGACLREGDTWFLLWGPFQPVAEPLADEMTLYSPSFYDLKGASYLKAARSAVLPTSAFRELLEQQLEGLAREKSSHEADWNWRAPSERDYQVAFSDIQERIKKSQLQKAVPVLFERAQGKVSHSKKVQMLGRLLNAPASLYPYGYWNSGEGILGATPEILFVQEGLHLKTMALAGTSPKAEMAQRIPLLEDAKERAEHDFVVQDILRQLQPFGDIHTQGPQLLELPTLWHLQTKIEVHLKFAKPAEEALNLIRQLHPTPALGVAPREADYHLLEKYPGQQGRARFGAPFALILPPSVNKPQKTICLVAIRNLQWNHDEVLIGAGGGVVAESEWQREWRELSQKRESVKKILGV